MLKLGSLGDKLCMCAWATSNNYHNVITRLQYKLGFSTIQKDTDILNAATTQLDEYFAGKRREFDIDLLLAGTEFQEAVWNALAEVPYGTTLTYGALARLIGMPKSVRAVANANAMNAISILVPCHRIIGSGGTLTGYAGGLAAKEWLLTHELLFQYQ